VHVARHGGIGTSGLTHETPGFRQLLRIARCRDDNVPLGAERNADCAADSAGPTGNECDYV
jgi:hypothetical protein